MTAVAVSTKCCTGCGEVKPLDAFSPHAEGRAGRQPRCKACRADYIRERRASEPLLVQRDRAQKEAYHASLRTLRDAHRAEFDALLARERYERGLDR